MRFALLGIPVEVHPTFWLTVLLLSGVTSARGLDVGGVARWIGLVFVSVLVHELGHAFAMRRFGREPSIALVGLGGETRWGDGPRVSPGRVALVSFAGPCAGFVLALPFVALHLSGAVAGIPWAAGFVRDALFVNVGWGVLNLLPILPLDGGKIADVLGFAAFGTRGARGVRVLSLVLAGGILAWALTNGMVWIAMLAGLSILGVVRQLPGTDLDPAVPAQRTPQLSDATRVAIDDLWNALYRGSSEAALGIANRRLEDLDPGDDVAFDRAALLEALAWVHLERGEDELAIAARDAIPESSSASSLLDARLLIARGQTLEGLTALDGVFLEDPSDRAAIVTAAAWLDANRPDRVVDMLRGIRGAGVGREGHRVVRIALEADRRPEHALAIAELAYHRFRDPETAYDVARALARAGRADDAVERLGRAIERGFRDEGRLVADEAFAGLRERDDFVALASKLRAAPRP